MTISNYIKQLQSYEEYAFSWNELLSNCNKTETSLKRELSRLVEKKEIINLRKGFYLIIPPRYSKQKQLPIQLYINKLFKNLERDYYLGFYSAAKFLGASHQQVQRDYIMINTPSLSKIKKKSIDISFLTTSKWPEKNILKKKSDAGIFKISSPALTMVDLIHHQTKLGGLNRMLAILEELTEELTHNDITELLTWYSHKSTLQRFGFLLEKFQENESLNKQIMEHLKQSKFYPVLLSPKSGLKPRAIKNPWKVDVNIKLENDL
ncbi:MAG: type IV toxin-antitoxin system AbiEi family antitoxin [Flavobacteriaceae bacterium]|nr:type IV toxin-antitoxin system AbiEi family antitoxin [Flavobacteriaceae bacterium]